MAAILGVVANDLELLGTYDNAGQGLFDFRKDAPGQPHANAFQQRGVRYKMIAARLA